MLYTVSAVQVLVMLDAVDELDKRGLGGKQEVGSCTIFWLLLSYSPSRAKLLQSSQDCRIRKLAVSRVTNGES